MALEAEKRTTDPFAATCFAAGIGALVFFPMIFLPVGFIAGIVSYYRLKENPQLKGRGLRIIGWILLSINIVFLVLF